MAAADVTAERYSGPGEGPAGKDLKRWARHRIRMELKTGRMHRPTTCQRCGKVPTPGRDGRSGLQAHHHDHSMPFDIEWICVKCHRAETRLPEVMGAPVYGERNSSSKITSADVLTMRSLRRAGKLYKDIGPAFGLDPTAAMRVCTGETWAHVSPTAESPLQPRRH